MNWLRPLCDSYTSLNKLCHFLCVCTRTNTLEKSVMNFLRVLSCVAEIRLPFFDQDEGCWEARQVPVLEATYLDFTITVIRIFSKYTLSVGVARVYQCGTRRVNLRIV
jgi:hypothetical protein